MSQAPSMPMFWDAYLADTTHLTTEEHGAYLLLLAAMWRRNGWVPDSDRDNARILGMTVSRWKRTKSRLADFLTFEDGQITQKNLLKIWKNTQEKIEKNRENGAKGGRPTSSKNKDLGKPNGYVSQNPIETIPEPEPDIKGGGGSAPTREADPPSRSEASTLREELLVAMGIDASGVTGPTGRIAGNMEDMKEYRRWQGDLGLDHATILTVIRETMATKRDGPPSTFAYFERPMRRAAAALAPKPILTPIEGGRRHDDDNQPARASRDPHARALGGMVESWSRVIAAQPGGRGGPDDGD